MATGTPVDLIKAQCPGAPEALIQIKGAEAARDFFIETCAWRKDISLAIVSGTDEYTPNTGELASVWAIEKIENSDGNEISVATYWLTQMDTLKFDPAPTENDTYTISAVLAPNVRIDSSTVDSGQWSRYLAKCETHSDTIVARGLYLLFSMPAQGQPGGVPWGNPVAALRYLAEYQSKMVRNVYRAVAPCRFRRWA